ncbi:MAG: replication protein RepA [Bryobacteraceae bacterium]|jgi:hypothetical protein
MVVLSEEFYRENLSHPIPADLEAAKALSSSAVLDLYMWLSYHRFAARGRSAYPLSLIIKPLRGALYATVVFTLPRKIRGPDLVTSSGPTNERRPPSSVSFREGCAPYFSGK